MIFQTKCLRGDLDEIVFFIFLNHVRSDIFYEMSGGDLDEKIDLHRINSRAH